MSGPLRVGVDVRTLQSAGGSAERGIGRYVADLLLGLRDHAPEIRPVLLSHTGHALPESLSGFEQGALPHASIPALLKLPKLRSSNALRGAHHRRVVEGQEAALSRAVAGMKLDLIHFPVALDTGAYPFVRTDLPVVRGFLDAIPLRFPEHHWDVWAPYVRGHYRSQLDLLKTASAVVAISRASADDARELANVSQDRLHVVYPAVSDRYRSLAPGPMPFGLEPEGYVLFCSVPDPHKNPEVAIDAFARAGLPEEVRLVFVVPHDRPEIPRLRQLSERLGLLNRFEVLSAVTEKAMPALFANALALLSPSEIEGFGLPAAQAMAAGTPVIASDRSALAEIVGGAGLLAPPDDPAAFATHLRDLWANLDERAELGARERERAERFRPETVSRALVEVYRAVIETRSPADATTR